MNKIPDSLQMQAENKKLRSRAEARLKKSLTIKNTSQLEDVERQLYEQRIDQIEIELLREEFARILENEAENGKDASLPETNKNGYFFLDRKGRICDLQFATTHHANENKNIWTGRYLSAYVDLEKRALFRDYLDEVFESGIKKSCELSFEQVLRKKNFGLKLPLYASVKAVADDEKKFCLVAIEDISACKLAERNKMQAAQQRHNLVIETAMDGFWMTDARGVLEEVNEAYAKMSGYTMQELVGMHISQLEVNERPEEVKAHINKLMALGHDRFATQHRRKDGSIIDIEVSCTFLPGSKEMFVFCRDITRRKQDEQALRVAAAAFETHDAILITDAQSNIIRVNRAFTEITGYSAAEVIGKNPRIMSSGRQDKAFYAAMWQHLLEHGCWAGEIWDRRKNDGIYPKWMTITAVKNEHGETSQYVAIFSDITERKRTEEQVKLLAFYDPLTQLPNRRLLNDRLSQTMAASKRNSYHVAVMFLDLDNFKPLNDVHGHVVGDLLLNEAAVRLENCVREMDTVARFGGDEFVVMISELYADKDESTAQAKIVAEKIRASLSTPYLLALKHDGQADSIIEHHCTVSIGVVVFINHEGGQDDILKWADEAMYQAKEAGRNVIRFYDWKV